MPAGLRRAGAGRPPRPPPPPWPRGGRRWRCSGPRIGRGWPRGRREAAEAEEAEGATEGALARMAPALLRRREAEAEAEAEEEEEEGGGGGGGRGSRPFLRPLGVGHGMYRSSIL